MHLENLPAFSYSLQIVAVAVAVAVTGLAAALVSRAAWDAYLRKLLNGVVFAAWRDEAFARARPLAAPTKASPPSMAAATPISEAEVTDAPSPSTPIVLGSVTADAAPKEAAWIATWSKEVKGMVELPESALSLPARNLAAQASARLQAAAEVTPETILPFLLAAARIDGDPRETSTPPGSRPAESSSDGAAVPPRDPEAEAAQTQRLAAALVDRATDDLHARLSAGSGRARYGLNISVGVLLAFLVPTAGPAPWPPLVIGIGVMAGLAGATIQTQLSRVLDR